jgi:prepilin-type N-terminal cleavage/methylation domain-containing protein
MVVASIKKSFTLIELLVVVAIIGILATVGIPLYQNFINESQTKASGIQTTITAIESLMSDDDSGGECSKLSRRHQQAVTAIKTVYKNCKSQGWAYVNLSPGLTCRSNRYKGLTKISGDGYTTKCVLRWNCSGFLGNRIFEHVRAELSPKINTSGFVRNNQSKNFENAKLALKKNSGMRAGLVNVQGHRVSTYLGDKCSPKYQVTNVK